MNLTINIESFGTMDTEEGLVVRIVYCRSDDPRRHTSFYPCDKTSAQTLITLCGQVSGKKPSKHQAISSIS